MTPIITTCSDLDQLLSLERLAFGEEAYSPAQLSLDPPYQAWILSQANASALAYAYFLIIPPEVELLRVGVTPGHRGRNLGFRLLAYCFSLLRGQGVEKVHLEVAQNNEPALSLYARLGFKTTNLRKDYYGKGHSACLMTLVLSPQHFESS
jgi:ribosomal protein S18 acetylase RimI-like enzyme